MSCPSYIGMSKSLIPTSCHLERIGDASCPGNCTAVCSNLDDLIAFGLTFPPVKFPAYVHSVKLPTYENTNWKVLCKTFRYIKKLIFTDFGLNVYRARAKILPVCEREYPNDEKLKLLIRPVNSDPRGSVNRDKSDSSTVNGLLTFNSSHTVTPTPVSIIKQLIHKTQRETPTVTAHSWVWYALTPCFITLIGLLGLAVCCYRKAHGLPVFPPCCLTNWGACISWWRGHPELIFWRNCPACPAAGWWGNCVSWWQGHPELIFWRNWSAWRAAGRWGRGPAAAPPLPTHRSPASVITVPMIPPVGVSDLSPIADVDTPCCSSSHSTGGAVGTSSSPTPSPRKQKDKRAVVAPPSPPPPTSITPPRVTSFDRFVDGGYTTDSAAIANLYGKLRGDPDDAQVAMISFDEVRCDDDFTSNEL